MAVPSLEKLRRELKNRGKPAQFDKVLVCRKGHALLWLIRVEGGHVPVAKMVGTNHFSVRTPGDLHSPPMSLTEWPAGELLPTASCECHEKVQVSIFQARSWLEGSRRKIVFEPVG